MLKYGYIFQQCNLNNSQHTSDINILNGDKYTIDASCVTEIIKKEIKLEDSKLVLLELVKEESVSSDLKEKSEPTLFEVFKEQIFPVIYQMHLMMWKIKCL